ncbi:MAG: pimeloyl-ACP methyl ester esterase BioH [Colwellia sp.]|nr:pimeloyl-ACP methyl ester esterase BioH [Colwellia sp.]
MAETLQITSQGQGIPLVLIHGWGLNSGVWQPLAEKLSTFCKVITVDLPGYGLNIDNNLDDYSLVNISDKIVEAINEPAVYLGWSLGGLVATDIAQRYQDDTLALITVASSPCFVEQSSTTEQTTWFGIKPLLLNAFHHQLAKDTKKTIDGFLKIQAMGSPHVRKNLKEIKDLIFQYDMPSRQTLDDSLALLEEVDLREELSLLTLPFLRLYGRLDSLIPKNVATFVDQLTPSSESYIFPHASHAPFISHPDDFFEVLKTWLLSNQKSL